MRHRLHLAVLGFILSSSASADVITDWNRTALPIISAYSLAAPSYRHFAMMHVAMFEAVNAVEPRFQSYKLNMRAEPGTSQDAAAAAAAAMVLPRLHPDSEAKIQGELKQSLAKLADGGSSAASISAGVALGEKVAAAVLELRAKDGSSAPDTYRPRTAPGRYVPTQPVAVPMWGKVTPWTMKTGAQFRPGPPLALESKEWAQNYNEAKQMGKDSKTRTPLQTETARLWLYTGPGTFFPLATQLSAAKGLDVHENARLYALLATATADAMIAVFDAKYRYEFWRPVTAIRNGDRDNNPATERDAGWEPIGPTPMHPEYPCAHCIVAASAGTVLQAFFGAGEVSEFSLSTPTAPGVTHRWTRIEDYIQEPSDARIWAGIHYRFSTVVGADMGRKIARQAVDSYFRPVKQ